MVVKTGSCIECGSALRDGAAFCTSCGASITVAPAAAPAAAATTSYESATCVECGKVLRVNAAFCTGCGRSTSPEKVGAEPVGVGVAAAAESADPPPGTSPVVVPPPPPSTVATAARNGPSPSAKPASKAVAQASGEAAAVGMVCGTCGKALRPGSVTCGACGGVPAPAITEEARQSGPKGARTIRATVGGGAASGYGMRTAGGASAPPPSDIGMSPLPARDDRRKRVIVAVAAAVLLLLACAGIVFAAMSSDDSGSVKASGSSGETTSPRRAGIGSGTSTSSDSRGDDSGAPVDSSGDSVPPAGDGTPGSTTAGTGTTQRPGSGGGPGHTNPPGGGGGGGGGFVTPPPPPPTSAALPAAVLQVGSSAVTIQGDSPSVRVRISNSGGQAYNFNTGTGGIPGGVSVSPASGTVRGGGWVDLVLTWNTLNQAEGFFADGFLNVSSNVGLRRISVSADSRKADEVSQWGWSGPACAGGSYLTYRVTFRAQGQAIPSPIRTGTPSVDRTTKARSTLNGVPGTGDTFDAPQRQGTNPDAVTYRARLPFSVNGGRVPQVEVTDTAGVHSIATWDYRCN